AGCDRREMEGADPLAASSHASPVRRAEAPGSRHQRENAHPTTSRDGGRRDCGAQGLLRSPAARAILADALWGFTQGSSGAAVRMGGYAHEAHWDEEGAVC